MTMNTARKIAMDAFPGRSVCAQYEAWYFPSGNSNLQPWTLTVFTDNGPHNCKQVTGKTFDQCMSKMREIIYPNNGLELADGDIGVDDEALKEDTRLAELENESDRENEERAIERAHA